MASLAQACRLLRCPQWRIHALTRGFKTNSNNAAAQNFNMPAMSPTMTEGNIAVWKVKEGERFSAGDVLLEIETDKAQIDVEAQEDGVLAKIFANNGAKGIPVGQRIAVLADLEDDLSKLEIPPDFKVSASSQEAPKAEKPEAAPHSSQPHSGSVAQLDSSSTHAPKRKHYRPPKEPYKPSPSVLGLLKLYKLTQDDIPKIPASGPRGRLLKGDVLAYVGAINKESPVQVEAIIDKLSHLDLSNIKIRQTVAPIPAPIPKNGKVDAEKKSKEAPSKPILIETDVQLEVSLEKLSKFQKEIQETVGFYPPVSTFLTEASKKANRDLPPSKLPPTASELFDELLDLPRRSPSASYNAQLVSLPPPTTFLGVPTSKKLDIIDILAGPKRGPIVRKVPTVPVESPQGSKVISIRVRKEDEVRGRVFLERVKQYLEAEPDRLFVSWGEAVRKSASAGLF
ncbi:mitochondrial pyruvate dehydrogenase protein x component-like protein [Kalaharituber pfeilii]|nr:mitochondrial pyruvate dehydrogenase protein x component-like protein [Kalaharituber pfeilii]